MTTKELSTEDLIDLADKDSYEFSWIEVQKVIYELLKSRDELQEVRAEIEVLKLGDIQWSHAFDLSKIEIEALKKELQEKEEFTKAWILYATKIAMLMPTRVDRSMGNAPGLSLEYQKGYNDAILEIKVSLKKASEK